MQTDNHTLIEELLELTENATRAARDLRNLPEDQLNFKEHAETWSILECIEHLNRYGEFYLPELEKAVLSRKAKKPSPVYKSGLFGNYFANLMKVSDGRMTKMKTFANKNPSGLKLTIITIDRFLKQQELLKSLLNQAREADLTSTKVPISLTKLIKLRLGDTFRFFVYHIERHILQANKVRDTFAQSMSRQ